MARTITKSESVTVSQMEPVAVTLSIESGRLRAAVKYRLLKDDDDVYEVRTVGLTPDAGDTGRLQAFWDKMYNWFASLEQVTRKA